MENTKYVLITAAKNEEELIEQTLKSVVKQTIQPQKWVIASDGSTDRTNDIVNQYSRQFRYIELVCKEPDSSRNFGSKVKALQKAYENIGSVEYGFIGNIDADISFDEDYFEKVLLKMNNEADLGITGGSIYEKTNGEWKGRPFNRIYSVANAVQLFRRECYEKIGGFLPLPHGGEDWWAEVSVRMNGWRVESIFELPVYHYRPTGLGDGVIQGGLRQGRMDFSLGSHPFFELIKCLVRVRSKPSFLLSFLRLFGFFTSYFRNEKRVVSDEFVSFLRQEQMGRLFALLNK